MQTLSRSDLDNAGVQNASELLDKISANASFGSFNEAGGAGSSFAGFTGASLRGLGYGRTLVLLNGRRVSAYAFSDGSGVDLIVAAAGGPRARRSAEGRRLRHLRHRRHRRRHQLHPEEGLPRHRGLRLLRRDRAGRRRLVARHGDRRLGRPDQGQVQRLRQRRLPEAGRAEGDRPRNLQDRLHPGRRRQPHVGLFVPGQHHHPGRHRHAQPDQPDLRPAVLVPDDRLAPRRSAATTSRARSRRFPRPRSSTSSAAPPGRSPPSTKRSSKAGTSTASTPTASRRRRSSASTAIRA